VSGHEVAPAVPVVIPVADGLADSNVQIDASRRFHRGAHSFEATVTCRIEWEGQRSRRTL
jgi:hypothetical protein